MHSDRSPRRPGARAAARAATGEARGPRCARAHLVRAHATAYVLRHHPNANKVPRSATASPKLSSSSGGPGRSGGGRVACGALEEREQLLGAALRVKTRSEQSEQQKRVKAAAAV